MKLIPLQPEEESGQPSPASSGWASLTRWASSCTGALGGAGAELKRLWGNGPGECWGPSSLNRAESETCKGTVLWELVLALSSRPVSTAEAQVT